MIEIICIALGIPLGYVIRKNLFLVKYTTHMLVWAVRLLLFLLGLSQGANTELLSNIHKIGLHSVIICTCCITGSLIAAKILNILIHDNKLTI